MAKKAKAKAGLKHKGKAANPTVGIISSITLTNQLLTAIKSGLNHPNASIISVDKQGYDSGTLEGCIGQFNATVDLIITVGGGVTYDAAASTAQKPFVSIVGTSPPKQAAMCYGGVDMHSVGSDSQRAQHIASRNHKSIGLYYNQKSSMMAVSGPIMIPPLWATATYPSSVSTTPGAYDASAFANDFKAIKNAQVVTALVVSADPFFQDKMGDLIPAAKSSGLYICYGLQDYDTGTLTKNNSTLWGPNLIDAYKLVGLLAGNVLSSGIKTGFIPTTDKCTDR
jgi:hypothetical protein